MVDVPTVSIVIASAGVFAAAIYYILQLRHQSRMRQTDLIVRLYSTFSGKELQEAYLETGYGMKFVDYNDYKKKYAPSPTGFSEKPEFIAFVTVGTFFQGVGVLLQMKLLDISLAIRLFGRSTIYTWEKMKPLVEGYRREGYPQVYADFEYLYNEMQKRKQRLQQIQQ